MPARPTSAESRAPPTTRHASLECPAPAGRRRLITAVGRFIDLGRMSRTLLSDDSQGRRAGIRPSDRSRRGEGMSPDGGIRALRRDHDQRPRFRHEALFYSGPTGFVDQAASFVREGVTADEPVLVAVPGPKVDMIRTLLGTLADRV